MCGRCSQSEEEGAVAEGVRENIEGGFEVTLKCYSAAFSLWRLLACYGALQCMAVQYERLDCVQDNG